MPTISHAMIARPTADKNPNPVINNPKMAL